MDTSPRSLTALLALLLAVAVFAEPALAKSATAAGLLPTLLSQSSRSDEDKARDGGRNPAGVLTFLGVAPGMTVLDVIAAGGYYTEVLSVAVGADGKVYAQNNEFVLKFRDGANDKAMTARLSGDRLPNVERVDAEMDALPIPDGSVDLAITALNFHDIYNGRGGEEGALAFLAGVHAKLKPGGVLGIVDHDGVAGLDNAKLHRIEKQKVLDVVAKSAFSLDGESELLANSGDDHTQSVFGPGLRGNTDRFVLLLRKAP
jgi:predicted methyltransferase